MRCETGTLLRYTACIAALWVGACGGDDDSDRDTGTVSETQTGSDTGTVSETQTDSETDTGADTGSDTAADPTNDFGFEMRAPRHRDVACSASGGLDEAYSVDRDWLCTFAYGGEAGHVYFKGTVSGCAQAGKVTVAVYDTEAFLSVGGEVTTLSGANYDFGGEHANDFGEFDKGGKRFKYYHSSFGFGWRCCQPMDCIQVFAPTDPATPEEDGYTSERTLPVVCLAVEAGASYGEADFEDSFEKCPGDPDA